MDRSQSEADDIQNSSLRMHSLSESESWVFRRADQAVTVGLNLYPDSDAGLSKLGASLYQTVGSGALTQGLNNAGLQVQREEPSIQIFL
jgi:hypothetical protein